MIKLSLWFTVYLSIYDFHVILFCMERSSMYFVFHPSVLAEFVQVVDNCFEFFLRVILSDGDYYYICEFPLPSLQFCSIYQ